MQGLAWCGERDPHVADHVIQVARRHPLRLVRVTTLNEALTNHAVHTHRAEEFVLVLRGDVRMTIGETKQTATVGDLVFLASNVPHALDNVGRGATEYFAFQGIP